MEKEKCEDFYVEESDGSVVSGLFTCKRCGSNKLAYQKYALCITPVDLHENGTVEYLTSTIKEDEYLATCNGFICLSCGTYVEHCGSIMETEQDLLALLNQDEETKRQQIEEYEYFIAGMIKEQEQRLTQEILDNEVRWEAEASISNDCHEEVFVAPLDMDPELRKQQQEEYEDYIAVVAEEESEDDLFELIEGNTMVSEQETFRTVQ